MSDECGWEPASPPLVKGGQGRTDEGALRAADIFAVCGFLLGVLALLFVVGIMVGAIPWGFGGAR